MSGTIIIHIMSSIGSNDRNYTHENEKITNKLEANLKCCIKDTGANI